MKRRVLLAMLLLTGCAHPEDRRWATLLPSPGRGTLPAPLLSVYSFATPAAAKTGLTVKDLAAEGQAAYINQLHDTKDASAFRRAVAAPIDGSGGLDANVAPSLDRTVVIGVQKDKMTGLADRLMRTVITIVPHDNSFEFTGYTVVATDNEVQSIAQLDTTTDASLDVTLAPPIKGFGDNSVEGKLDRSHETKADINQQYEKLNVDIQPGKIVITRESERGLDVVGNTIIKLSLTPNPPKGMASGSNMFLVSDDKLFNGAALLKPIDASLEIATFASPLKCALQADVSMDYRARHVVEGAEYYTEGKQGVQIVDDALQPATIELVRAQETAPALWQIVIGNGKGTITAHTIDGTGRILTFNNYDAAQKFAFWLRKTGATSIGKDGVTFTSSGISLLGADVHAAPYKMDCRPSGVPGAEAG